jgi:hypothetical protein
MFKAILLAGLILAPIMNSANAASPASNEIVKGYRSADGHVLLEMSSKQFRSGNVFFLGNAKKLKQLEITWDDSSSEERVLTYVAAQGDEPSEITFSKSGVSLQNGLVLGEPHLDQMAPLSETELKTLSHASLQTLPVVWESKYLFQSSVSGEYVLVKEPVFNFHGNYRVWIGELTALREVPVKAPENGQESMVGNIQFEAGGGLFVPKMGELLSALRPTQAEMPTLIRSSTSGFEVLKVPRLSPVQLARLGFVRDQAHVLSAQR